MITASSSTAETVGLGVVGFYLVILIVMLWAYIRIIQRAGYSGWWILIGLVPLVNVVMFLLFAFKEWPIQRELAHLRAMTGQGYRSGPQAFSGGYPPAVAGGYPPAGTGGYPPAVTGGYSPGGTGGYPPEDSGDRSRFGSAWPDERPR